MAPQDRNSFEIALICALPLEASYVHAAFDRTGDDHGKTLGDGNSYTTGWMGGNGVVLTHMPGMGTNAAAAAAANLKISFPCIKLAVVVGICGGVPSKQQIRLGDVVISQALVQYDFGRQYPQAFERRRDNLSRANPQIRALQAKLETTQHSQRLRRNFEESLRAIQSELDAPRPISDILCHSSSIHRHRVCDKCEIRTCEEALKADCEDLRCDGMTFRDSGPPSFHFGTIGSGNTLMKSGQHRDEVAGSDIIAFEMEGAGIWEYFPTVIIKGVSDYADSHKKKVWQPYAAAVAAAYAKAYLMEWDESHQLVVANDQEQELKVMESLSMVNFWGRQDDILKHAQPGTCRWIFDDPTFKSWLAGDFKILWCVGEAGAGKTTLASIIINHLPGPLAWMYIDYREHDDHVLENLLANVLVQLFRHRGKVSSFMMKSLGTSWRQLKPTLSDYRSWLQYEMKQSDQLTIIVDAFDELRAPELGKQFINEMLQLGLQILVTSRSAPSFDAVQINVHPRQEDVVLYVESRLEQSPKLRNLRKDAVISKLIIDKLSEASDRMFLKAELILNLFEHISVDEVDIALKSLPPSYDECYEFSLKQIERNPDQREKAFRILSFLAYSSSRLTAEALQHALSVRPGMEELREMLPLGDILSVCRGLVVVQNVDNVQTIRLMHETANEFLRAYHSPHFPNGHEVILQSSLAYLSLSCFSRLCLHQVDIEERSRKYPFFEYAAEKWPKHAIDGELELAYRDEIVSYLESSIRLSADEFLGRRRPSAWSCNSGTPWTDWNKDSNKRRDLPLHAAAAYGLRKTLHFFIEEKGVPKDALNNFGETALHRAAQWGQTDTMDELLRQRVNIGATVAQHYLGDTDSLMLAANCHQIPAVQMLINHGVSVNKPTSNNLWVPLHLAASMWTDLTQLLLDYGADVNRPGGSTLICERGPLTSLHFAVLNPEKFDGAIDRVTLLLDRGANINAQSGKKNTPLHIAMQAGNQPLIIVLLQRGADFRLQNEQGRSAVQIAREMGYFRHDQDLVPPNFLQNLKAIPELHQAAWMQETSRVNHLLSGGVDINLKDDEGRTVWNYCIGSGNMDLAKVLLFHTQKHPEGDHIGYETFKAALDSMSTFDYIDHDTWRNSLRICKLLLEYAKKSDPSLQFAQQPSPIFGYQKTLFIWSVWEQRTEEAQFFLDCGADINAVDKYADSAVHHALKRRDLPMTQFLVERGCNLKLRNIYGETPLHGAKNGDNLYLKEYLEIETAKQ